MNLVSRWPRRGVGAAISLLAAVASLPLLARPASAEEYRRIHFPVHGHSSYSDDFGDPRSGGRTHEGNDIFGAKLQPLLSAVDGRVGFLRIDSGGLSGNMVSITDSDGWRYRYIHVNNDSPGTDDGANPPEWLFTPDVYEGARVKKGQQIAFLGDSGNAEGTAPHLHFEIIRPDGTSINPWTSLRLSQGLRGAGNRCAYDENPAGRPSTTSAEGYYVLGSDGGIFSFGNAPFHGSTGGLHLQRPVVGMTATPSGDGYWMVASDGGIFAFGDAGFRGSTGGLKLNKPIVGMASTPSGDGYWMVASDGGIFAFGDAGFHGSTGGLQLSRPVVSIAGTSGGYWLLAEDGGVFAFGNSGYFGSLPATGLCTWPSAASIAPTASGDGYWIQARDGTTWSFGDAWDYGGVSSLGLTPSPRTIGFVPAN